MKRNLIPPSLKRGLLAVPAAALMLGAAQAGTTIGLNFQSWYYDSGVTPQTIGYGAGYQTTGFPVTAKAFGVATANWFNTDPLDCNGAVSVVIPFNSLSLQADTKNMWESNIGPLIPGFVPGVTVAPGNDELTWSFEDNTGWTNTLSGLNAVFPNGYVMELIGAGKCTTSSRVVFTAGATSFTNAFGTIYTAGNAYGDGPVGLMATPTLTDDSVTFGAVSRDISSAQSCALAGFIVTDKPVVVKDPPNTSVNSGATLKLTAASVIGVGTLSYQWRLASTPIPGAIFATYTNLSMTPGDGGGYDVIVNNPYGSATSGVATVSVLQVPVLTTDLAGLSGTIYSGANVNWSVVAGGAPTLHYSWFKTGTSVGTDSPSLALTSVTTGDSGNYYVKVTNTPFLGFVYSKTNALTVVTSPDLYTTDVAQDSPGAYWPLGEASGILAYDYSGAGHIGDISNSVTPGVNGPRPPSYAGFNASKLAYQFDGASGFINCGTGPSLSGTTDFTLEAWVNTTATTAGVIVQQRDAAGFNGEYRLIVNADGTVNFLLYGGGTQFNFSSSKKVNDGNWHYVAAARRNGTNGVIYIDGSPAAVQNVAYLAPLDNTFITYIGADKRDSGSYFNGAISDVAIYPYALSEHRIILHAYNGKYGTAPFSISIIPGGYVLDTKPIGPLYPGVNNGASWTSTSTDTTPVPVTRSGVEVFTGNSQIATPVNPDFDSPNGTICFWMRTGIPAAGTGTILFDRRAGGAGLLFGLNGTPTGAIDVQYTGGPAFATTSYVVDDNWHYVAVTYDQSVSGSVEVFVDGVSVGIQANIGAWSWTTTQPIELGRSHDPYWQKYNGQMDDFRIYSRVLTQPEIASIQSSGALVDTAALKVRYNFDTPGGGESLSWPIGALESSPALSPATWTPVPNAVSPYPFLPPAASPAGPALFYRAGF